VIKKETLKVANLDNDENVLLFSIASSESDIHLCLLINKIFKISISLADDLIVVSKKESTGFRKYKFENAETGEKYILLLNRNSSGKFLITEFKKIDFIFLIISEMHDSIYDKPIQRLKNENTIAAIFKIDPKTIRSFNKLKL
jgi:hypothetical protein